MSGVEDLFSTLPQLSLDPGEDEIRVYRKHLDVLGNALKRLQKRLSSEYEFLVENCPHPASHKWSGEDMSGCSEGGCRLCGWRY